MQISIVNLNLLLSRLSNFVYYFKTVYLEFRLNYPFVYEFYISCWNTVISNLIKITYKLVKGLKIFPRVNNRYSIQ